MIFLNDRFFLEPFHGKKLFLVLLIPNKQHAPIRSKSKRADKSKILVREPLSLHPNPAVLIEGQINFMVAGKRQGHAGRRGLQLGGRGQLMQAGAEGQEELVLHGD